MKKLKNNSETVNAYNRFEKIKDLKSAFETYRAFGIICRCEENSNIIEKCNNQEINWINLLENGNSIMESKLNNLVEISPKSKVSNIKDLIDYSIKAVEYMKKYKDPSIVKFKDIKFDNTILIYEFIDKLETSISELNTLC